MIYIKLDDEKDLIVTTSDPVYQGDNLNQKMIFLISPQVGDIDMLQATVYLNYIRADGTPNTIILEKQEDDYKGFYQYCCPVEYSITKFAGEVQMWIQIYADAVPDYQIAKTGPCNVAVLKPSEDDTSLPPEENEPPTSGMCSVKVIGVPKLDDYISDDTLTVIHDFMKETEQNFDDLRASLEANKVQSDWEEKDEKSLAYIKNKIEPEDNANIINDLLTFDLIPAIQDAGGILSDEAGNILVW